MVDYVVSAYVISRTNFDNADGSLGRTLGFTFSVGTPVDVTISDDDGLIDAATLGTTNVTIGVDDRGPITDIVYRTITNSDGTSFDVAVISLGAVSTDVLIIPLNPTDGSLTGAVLPPATQDETTLLGGYEVEADLTLAVPMDIAGPPANTDPDAVDDTAVTDEDNAVTITVLTNDTDADGDSPTIAGTTDPSNGSVTVNPDGTITYTPDADFHGSDSFSYTIDDGNGGSDTATVNVTVNAVNDDPDAVADSASTNEDTAVNIDVLANDTDADGDSPTVALVAQGNNGSVVIESDGTVTYTPGSNFNGTDSFTYMIDDGNGGTDTATVTVTVDPVNDAPIAGNDAVTMNEDSSLSTNVLWNDSDVDGDPLSVVSVTQGANGSVVIETNGSVTYTPNADFNGSDSFSYTVSDGNGGTDTATVNVTVLPSNDAPVPGDDDVATTEDTPLNINVLTNDSDLDGDTLSVASVGQGAHGSVAIETDGTITYTPDADFNGTDAFSYVVSDGNGGSDTATVNVTVNPANDAPDAVDDTAVTDEDNAVTISVLANDTDPDGDSPTIAGTTDPSNGSLTVNPDGTITYTPDAGFNGSDSFSYTIDDGNAGSDTATVNVTVNAVNDDPDAVDDIAVTDEDNAVTITVLANDTDVDGDSPTIAGTTDPSNGSLTVNPDGTITYTPDADFHGSDSFSYTIDDGNGGSDTATVNVTVNAVRDDPFALYEFFTTDEDTPLDTAGGVSLLDNDTPGEPGDTLTVTAFQATTAYGAAVSVAPDGTFTYDPTGAPALQALDAGANVQDGFTYTIEDQTGATSTAWVYITVNGVNDAPVAEDDSFTVAEDGALLDSVTSNDTDPEGDAISLLAVDVSNGVLVLNHDGTFSYTPDADFTGTDSFTYVLRDPDYPNTPQDAAVVTITVDPAEDDPIAVADTATTDEDSSVNIAVLDNDSDPDGDPLTFVSVSDGSNGTVAIELDGTVTYTPDANFNGTDGFTYTVEDGNGGSDTTTVEVTVNAVDDAPVANDDSYTTGFETALTISAPGLLANDYDVDGDPLSLLTADAPTNGTLVLQQTGEFTYTPDAGFSGTDTFDYRLDDGQGGFVTATVEIEVAAPVNTPPVAENDFYVVNEDDTGNANVFIGVLSNDSDPDGDPLTVSLDTDVSNGSLILNTDGSFTYTPDANFNGTDSFTYEVSDGNGGTDTATVDFLVLAVDDAPVANDDSYTTGFETALTISAPGLLANDYDVDGDPLSLLTADAPTNGTLVLQQTGEFTYTPDAGFSGTDTFDYRLDDGQGGFVTATVEIEVAAPAPDPVYSVNDVAVLEADGTATFTITRSVVTDVESPPLTLTLVEGTATAPEDYVGQAPVTFTFAAGQTEATISVTLVDDAVVEPDEIFTFELRDEASATLLDTGTGTILNDDTPNTPPVAAADTYAVDEDGKLVVPAVSGLLANDSDPDGDALVGLTLGTGPVHGGLTLNADGSFEYTPDADFNGTDSFTYSVEDGNGGTDIATVTLNVTPVNDRPDAVDDTAATDEDNAVNIDVLGNDTDADGDTLTVASVTDGSNGTVVIEADGTVTYTPNANFHGTDSFTYQVEDPSGAVDGATVEVTVNAVNDPPVAENDTAGTEMDVAVNIDVLGNDTDADGDTLVVDSASVGANGTVNIEADGSVTYTPNAGFTGTDSFTYIVSDGNGGTDEATVEVSVDDTSTPVFVEQNGTPYEDTLRGEDDQRDALFGKAGDDVLIGKSGDDLLDGGDGSDKLYGGDGADILKDGHGRDYLKGGDGDDLFLFQGGYGDRASGGRGVDTFVLTTGLLDNGFEDVIRILDYEVGVDLLDIPEGYIVTVESVTVERLELAVGPDGDTVYLMGVSDISDVTFLSDATLNHRPLAVDDSAETTQDTQIAIDVLSNDSDPDGDHVSLLWASQGTYGTVTLGENGSLLYTPDAGFSGTDSFTYDVSDGHGGFDEATVTVTVLSDDDPEPEFVELVGTKRSEALTGADDQNDLIFGKGGHDTIRGLGGDDNLRGGGGNDIVLGHDGNDHLFGGSGNDRLYGGDGDDTFRFHSGFDRARGGAGRDTFVMTDKLSDNGKTDRVEILDYESGLDLVDLGGASITLVQEYKNAVKITFGPDDDILILRGINDADQIGFVDNLV